MKWTQIYDIALLLEEKFPKVDVMTVKFTDLQKYVLSLDEFEDDPKGCNEKILEAIQQTWIDERE